MPESQQDDLIKEIGDILDRLLSPQIEKGQVVHEIKWNGASEITCKLYAGTKVARITLTALDEPKGQFRTPNDFSQILEGTVPPILKKWGFN